MYWVKHVLGIVLSPLAAAGLLGLAGGALLFSERTRRAGMLVLAGLVLVGFPLGTTPVANALIRPIERDYIGIQDPRFLGGEIRWVVVLGAGHVSDSRSGEPGWILAEGLYRLTEGIRLWRALPDARLHLSGWSGGDERSYAEAAAEVAMALGVPEEALVLASEPRDTREEAEAVARRIDPDEPFLLVTGAAHLRRAVVHFEAAGLSPIPVPAFFYAREMHGLGLRDFLPHPDNYMKLDRVVHEYLGLAWARITSPRSAGSTFQHEESPR